jgi:hypothetical protein
MQKLPFIETKNRSAVEYYFCQKFAEIPLAATSKETGQLILKIAMMAPEIVTINERIYSKEFPLYDITSRRLNDFYTFNCDYRTKLFLCHLVKGSVSSLISYLTYLQYWAYKQSKQLITFDVFIKEIFPKGFPTNEDVKKLYETCTLHPEEGKVLASSNLLDYPISLSSIQFTKTNCA